MLLEAGLAALVSTLALVAPAKAEKPADTRCYELRVYTAAPGKLDALHARFRDHTCQLFEKHGMTNVGYWAPLDNSENKLYYILAYPDRAARNQAWQAFLADSEWHTARDASEKDGKLVAGVESTFLHATDYSPKIAPKVGSEPPLFELRTYTCTPDNLDNLDARFRDHTIDLFTKHGMRHFGYWWLDNKQKGAGLTLVYMLEHKSKEACEASFAAFREDPTWIAAKEASEKEADGSLTAPDGVKSVLLVPTDYSPTK
ncbi:MAG: NIPSNAP family protein [Pirellulales bacterium]|nr:NIPSNAP family protein [Pirellulales bacterium]